jgi:hypothetical protein
VLPAVALFLLLPPTVPYLRALVPIEQTLLLLVTALAVCAWVAWKHSGPLWLALIWTGIAVWVFTKQLPGGSAYAALAYGWSLLLAGAFGVVSLVRPHRPFFGRAMMSLAIAAIVGTAVLAAVGTTPQRVERVVSSEFAARVELSLATWREWSLQYPNWAAYATGSIDLEMVLRQLITVGGALFPAILMIESLAALGLAWSLHHRLSRTRIGPPIAPLREFRFEDQFIWGVILGLVLLLMPELMVEAPPGVQQIGWNLLLFFGGLYGLRGLGVMTWFLVFPGRWLGAALVAACALLPPLWSFPIGIGLGDTYFDWRRRIPPSNQGS